MPLPSASLQTMEQDCTPAGVTPSTPRAEDLTGGALAASYPFLARGAADDVVARVVPGAVDRVAEARLAGRAAGVVDRAGDGVVDGAADASRRAIREVGSGGVVHLAD